MTPASCPDSSGLERLALGQLPGPEADALERHVLGCSRCGERLQALQAADPMFALFREAGQGSLPSAVSAADALVERLVLATTARVEGPVTPSTVGPPAPVVVRDDTDEETRALLQWRLLVVFSILAAVGGAACLAELLTGVAYQWWHWLQPCLWGRMAVFLTIRRPSLSALRVCELVGFGSIAAVWAYLTVVVSNPDVLRRQGEAPYGTAFPAYSISLLWFSLLAVYATAVPNTWRRAALVIGGLALAPFVIALCTWWFDPPPLPLQVEFLIYLGWWMALGFATAVFGSHKISQLRQEAAEARRLGPYTLVRKLGAGGMGEVHLAEHRLLKRPCAVKLVRPDRAAGLQLLERFEREAQATAGLSHPNAVQVFDYGHSPDGTFYYVMEYLPGLNLQELVERHGPLPPGRVVHLLRQVCGALREAHTAGLVHRDIKPGNVILCERGGIPDVAKLLDFGLVRDMSGGAAALTQDGTITGTPAFMAPEQASGAGVDARADIYSVGALAYFLLAGRAPFAGMSAMAVIAAQLYEPPAPPSRHFPGVPADLESVVLRCLAKAPAERFQDVAALDAALGACECAGQWSQAEAAAWWRLRPPGPRAAGS